MKIEKISNSQIRCILTGEDLASRQLRLSELAYGTEKARALFRDMMEQAAIQCGFDAENYPLMIEAIPLGADSIVLIVTKVDNPEELDTRFSNFAPSVKKDALPQKVQQSQLSQLLNALKENSAGQQGKTPDEIMKEKRDYLLTSRLYSFESISDVIRAAKLLSAPWQRSPSTDSPKRSAPQGSNMWSRTAVRSLRRMPLKPSQSCKFLCIFYENRCCGTCSFSLLLLVF